MADTPDHANLLRLTAQIVSAHAAKNMIPADSLPGVITSVFQSLSRAGTASPEPEPARAPAVPVKKSVFPDYLICLEDGKKLKTMKRHLSTSFGLTPKAYREKWGLPPDYPMVAPAYTKVRSDMARQIGLGRKVAVAPQPQPEPAPVAGRGRRATKRQPDAAPA